MIDCNLWTVTIDTAMHQDKTLILMISLIRLSSKFFKILVLLYDTEDESAKASSHQPVRGSFLNLLPPQIETPEKNESQ